MVYSNILVRVPNWLGDTLMSTPAVSAVKKLFPKSKLSILAKPVYNAFWKDFPGVDEVISLDKGLVGFWKTVSSLKQKKFDAALILPTSFSSAFLAFAANIPARIGWQGEGRDLFLTHWIPRPQPRQKHLVLEYLELVHKGFDARLGLRTIGLQSPINREAVLGLRQVWAEVGIPDKGSFIALAPGATFGPAKRWPLPYWKELIKKLLTDRRESLLILGGLEEKDYLKPLVDGLGPKISARVRLLAGRTSPTILAATLAKCKLLVTNDTGPMHAAAGAGTPTVSIFGSTSPAWTRPFGIGHTVIYKHLECSPCFQKTCPIGYKCLRSISVEEVFNAVIEILRKPRKIKNETFRKIHA